MSDLDHLNSQLSSATGKDRITILLDIAEYLYEHKPQEMRSYLDEAIQLATDLGDAQALAQAYAVLGRAYRVSGELDEALRAYETALELAGESGYRNLLPSIYLNLGLVQMEKNDFEMAGEHLETGLEIARNNGDKRAEMECYKALAELCEAEQNFEEALSYFKQYAELKDALHSEVISDLQARDAEIYHLRNIELAEMNRTLERIDHEKNNFLKVVAHDLQGPLSSIQMNADMLRNYFESLPPDKIRQRLDAMIDTANAMTQTVTQILDLRLLKSGKGQFDLSVINPVPLALQVVETYREKAHEKDIQIHHSLDGHVTEVLADEVALRRVLDNLVSNAVKYTEPGNDIFVSITDEEQVSIIIRDEGLGMTEEDLEMVFNEFMTLSARPTGRERSTGLGLAIVKMLVEGMNATIKAESEGKGQGSTFTITLPHPQKS